jgi:uncharacterized membrane protein
MYPQHSFNRGVIEPIECVKAGLQIIKPHYWLWVGICAIGMIVGSLVPFGILMGPMMCGIYLTLLKARRAEPIEFGLLFKGFDYFGASVVATLIHLVPVAIVIVPSYLFFYIGLFAMAASSNGQPDPAMMLSFMGFFVLFWLAMIVIIMIISVLFTFVYPLIVDRGLSGVDAVKLSAKAAFANFWRLLLLFLLNALITFAGALLCYVGAFLMLPITFAALANAYERVFGLSAALSPNLPPPPPQF